MKEKWVQIKNKILAFWSERTKGQKGMILGGIGLLLVIVITITALSTSSNYVPLYSDLTLQESGQITEELEVRGISYELKDGGTTILVPENESDQLLVELAGQGIPSSGNIDYSFFSENSSWGITDNEFNIMKLDAMQTELANLIKGIEGIEDAKVMINLPEETIFVSDNPGEASASIVLNTRFGQEFKDNQIESLYHLVSKAVPNLPEDNIVIMNQFFEYYDQASSSKQDYFTNHHEVKKEIERDLQRKLQQMLGTMVGMDSVIVSVTADIDSTSESRVEEIIEPVDIENMEGLPVSIENIHETYSGGDGAEGIPGVGDEDIANYPGTMAGQDGDYELVKESVNNEFNRIHKDIIESPHKIRDLGIQVVVNNVRGFEGDELQLLSQEEQNTVEEGINSILNSIITTSIDKDFGEIEPEEKISVVFQQFSEQPTYPEGATPTIPMWLYIIGAILLVLAILIVLFVLRKRKDEKELDIEDQDIRLDDEVEIADLTDQPLSESEIQLKQLEKLAEDNPEDFAKLLRSWISED